MDERMSYGAWCKVCGHLCGAAIDNPDNPERTARHVAGFIREGLIVGRVTNETVRSEFHRCTCENNEGE